MKINDHTDMMQKYIRFKCVIYAPPHMWPPHAFGINYVPLNTQVVT